MRTYGQFCALAKALDVIGDRWTLLIVRELLARDGSRYTDLHHGLPGIATNLLADRLRDMEAAGIVSREAAPPPIATTLYRLTDRGAALHAVVEALGRWGGPLLARAPGGDAFRTHWLALPAGLHLRDTAVDGPPITIEIRTGEEPLLVEVSGGSIRFRSGGAEHPDAVLDGSRAVIVEILAGKIDLIEARAQGLRYEGDPMTLARLQPAAIRP